MGDVLGLTFDTDGDDREIVGELGFAAVSDYRVSDRFDDGAWLAASCH